MAGDETRVTKISSIKELATPVEAECCFVQIHGPGLGKKYPLEENEFTIGREEGNHIVVDLDNVSRRHAMIIRKQGRMFVKDLGSTNGTYLNDQEVTQETPLRSGDLIKVGGSIFKFLTGDNVETAVPRDHLHAHHRGWPDRGEQQALLPRVPGEGDGAVPPLRAPADADDVRHRLLQEDQRRARAPGG